MNILSTVSIVVQMKCNAFRPMQITKNIFSLEAGSVTFIAQDKSLTVIRFHEVMDTDV
jgi:hypothetical protein